MYRATTPTIRFNVPVDLTEATSVYATFEQGDLKVTKTDTDLTITSEYVDVYLTQAETLKFTTGTTDAQLNWLYVDDGVTKRNCSNIVKVTIRDNLIDEVITE